MMMMAVRGSTRRNVKWVIPGRSRVLIISLLPLSSFVTSSHQYTDQKTTPPSNETNGNHAKVFYKHTWPVRVFNIHNFIWSHSLISSNFMCYIFHPYQIMNSFTISLNISVIFSIIPLIICYSFFQLFNLSFLYYLLKTIL